MTLTRLLFFVLIVSILWTAHFILAQTPQWRNVALNKPCNMSSSYSGDGFNNNCSCAINGNKKTTYLSGNCIHTNDSSDKAPTWTVYLGQIYLIERISVYARDYELNQRLGLVQVLIDSSVVYNFSDSPLARTHIIDGHLPKTGSEVGLRKINDGSSKIMLNICEVQVFVLVRCNPNPCANGGTCTEDVSTYNCSCTHGYIGINCTSDIDECTQNPKPCNHGNCSNTNGSYTCQCPEGFKGTGTTNCSDINECESSKSLCNNGTCMNNPGSFSCHCNEGFTDKLCQTDFDECGSNLCKHGNCTDLVANYSCHCWPGYEGSNCETVIDAHTPSSAVVIGGAVGGSVAAVSVIILIVLVVFHVRRRINKNPQTNCNNGLIEDSGEVMEGPYVSVNDASISKMKKQMDKDKKPSVSVNHQSRQSDTEPQHGNKSGGNAMQEKNTSREHLYGNTKPGTDGYDELSQTLEASTKSDRNFSNHHSADLLLTAKPALSTKPKPNATASDTSTKYATSSDTSPRYENVTQQANANDVEPGKKERPASNSKPIVPRKSRAFSKQHQANEESNLDRTGGNMYYNTTFEEEEEEVYGHANMYVMYGSKQKAASMLDNFQKQLLERLKGADSLDIEFKAFPKGMLHPHDVGIDPKHNKKNRFQQLCAYDSNRVILRRPKDDPDTDYINASWIEGLDSQNAYIAAQGPKASSVADFWWMVWQDNVTQIVMLTNLKEDGKSKCEQYWPEVGRSITYGNITVTAEREAGRADFIIRTFLIHPKGENQKERIVYQYHYVSWPDHNVPGAASLVNFWRYVTARGPPAAPPVIHCSAGVGRTGTYIALDIAMGRVSRGLDVNVFDIVMELREQRSIMVQTDVQYKFLHEVVLEAYTSRNSRLTAEQLDLRFATDIDVNTPDTAVDNEFRLLKEIKGWAKPNNTTAELDENRDKNRNPKVLPEEEHIAFLSVYVKGRNQYINAVYLSSFTKRRSVLLTQLPLPHTLVDLWRLVEGCDVTTILSLGANDDDRKVKNYCSYWPRVGEELNTGPYHLKCSSTSMDTENISTNTVLMTNMDNNRYSVRIIHYTDWSGEVPGSISDVIYLVNLVRAASEESEGPVLIQCLDGATKSGIFCVLYDVICRLTEDDEVDIFPVVRHVQCVRRLAVSTEKQYRYCYRVAQHFNKSRSLYANT